MNTKCTLSNDELIEACNNWVSKLAKSGGSNWRLTVPVSFNTDPDMLFCELAERFKDLLSDKSGQMQTCHMAGQSNAGCKEPSASEALAYVRQLLQSMPQPTNKQEDAVRFAEFVVTLSFSHKNGVYDVELPTKYKGIFTTKELYNGPYQYHLATLK